ncbi:arginine--tRNA ligase [Pararhizobium sp. IMCC21322]|uniref:arginine--tRNA ligase n=1 Tax=Pararhizobium sp. IMCC21322 TaxID=3067903 RepID=UPI002740FB71|nr:arginine--tRNA ligase [Pararhizobium sp. IMCC21322]
MNIYADFAEKMLPLIKGSDLLSDLDADAQAALPLDRIVVEPPRDATHGDLATNAALLLAKGLRRKPRDIAEAITELLTEHSDALQVQSVSIAGPGFINITLQPVVWQSIVQDVLRNGMNFGRTDLGQGEKINVEYVSANPTGPMHVGHCRGAVFGDALATLLSYVGYDVTREYYINDAGAQVDVLAQSAYLRYREALGEVIGAIPEGLYPGEYLMALGAQLKDQHGSSLLEMDEAEWLPIVKEAAISAMLELIRSDLDKLGVVHDVFFSERSLTADGDDRVAEMIADLRERDLIYLGTLPPPKGKLPDDWEDREQTLFRSTRYGDDVDRALLKSDGSYTYFASDIAYHFDKYKRGFNRMVDVLGADHQGYLKRMTAAVTAISSENASLDIRFCQLVNLFRDGQPVKMSKRSGNLVTLADVVDEVGRDVTRFIMLYRKNDATLDFDFTKVLEQSKDNPVFYVQYAHARTHSTFAQAIEVFDEKIVDGLEKVDISILDDASELALMRKLAEYPRIVEAAANFYEPHRIAFYLNDLASAFHGHWNKGKDLPQLRFIKDDNEKLTRARLALVLAVQIVLRSGLGLLGVDAREELR